MACLYTSADYHIWLPTLDSWGFFLFFSNIFVHIRDSKGPWVNLQNDSFSSQFKLRQYISRLRETKVTFSIGLKILHGVLSSIKILKFQLGYWDQRVALVPTIRKGIMKSITIIRPWRESCFAVISGRNVKIWS